MRITTWNVNGIKTLPQYHPWNKLKTYEAILDELGGDITCIQETKITRAQLDASLATPPSYDSFFSFFRGTTNKPKGIHGTAIFTKRSTVVPLKAEEGLTSVLVPAQTLEEDRIGGYPLGSEVDLTLQGMKDLDAEGRTTVCDFGMFVLVNLYSPNLTNEDRQKFKDDFNALVDARVRNLIRQGRQVIVVGDLNICRNAIDCANPEERVAEANLDSFEDTAPRRWLSDFTSESGPMIDITRRLHPDRKGMFTCWNMKIDARPANFGTRLDYILITPGLLPWVKHADIQATTIGSDHCPVYLDLHNSIPSPDPGQRPLEIWDLLNPGRKKGDPPPNPPLFAARYLDEFSGKQRKLASFFVKAPQLEAIPAAAPSSSAPVKGEEELERVDVVVKQIPATAPPRAEIAQESKPKTPKPTRAIPTKASPKLTGGQSTLAGFFTKPQTATTAEPESKKAKRQGEPTKAAPAAFAEVVDLTELGSSPPPELCSSPVKRKERGQPPQEQDPLAGMTAEQIEAALTNASDSAAASASAWSGLMKPKPIPRCNGHGEPTRQWTVNKPGLNKGRKFYLCARPVGPATDKEARCDFFAWDVSVRRPAPVEAEGGSSAKKAKI